MKTAARSRRDRIRSQLADPKMPGALESLDDVLTGVDGGGVNYADEIFGMGRDLTDAVQGLPGRGPVR